jgi:hypothetical protein
MSSLGPRAPSRKTQGYTHLDSSSVPSNPGRVISCPPRPSLPPHPTARASQNPSSSAHRAPMAALLRTAAALAPPPPPAWERCGRCVSLLCSRRAPAQSLRAWLPPTPRVPGQALDRLRRLAATEADEASQTATQVRGRSACRSCRYYY